MVECNFTIFVRLNPEFIFNEFRVRKMQSIFLTPTLMRKHLIWRRQIL